MSKYQGMCVRAFSLAGALFSGALFVGVDNVHAQAGGPFLVTITQKEIFKDRKGALPTMIDHANPNPGGTDIPWATEAGLATTVGWSVSVSAGGADLGLAINGSLSGSSTINVGTAQSGVVNAPPAAASRCGAVNHDVEFFAYEAYKVVRIRWEYFTNAAGEVTNASAEDIARRAWTTRGRLVTYKESEENYGENNYPRPDPYTKHEIVYYWGAPAIAQVGGTPAQIGLRYRRQIVSSRDWS